MIDHHSRFIRKLADIQTLFLDVDGVLTDNSVLITEDGQLLRRMNVKDGLAIKLALKNGYDIVVITGGSSIGVESRLKSLGITEVHSGVSDKLSLFQSITSTKDLKNCLYIGDDLPDLAVMKIVGCSCCPKDGAEEVKEIADYISPYLSGSGVVRDVVEHLLKVNQKWDFN